MDDENDIEYFLSKCDELMNSNFILAKSKLSDLLKAITASETLTQLFTSVVSGFDYFRAKNKCFVSTNDGRGIRKMVVLPQMPTDKLAFVFCLLVDFDNETIRFNDFLLTYFYCVDDYSKSFNLFCEQIIYPFRNLVRDAFSKGAPPAETEEEKEAPPVPSVKESPVPVIEPAPKSPPAEKTAGGEKKKKRFLSGLRSAKKFTEMLVDYLNLEKRDLQTIDLPADEIDVGLKMLDELWKYILQGNVGTIKAILCGYSYFLAYHSFTSENVNNMFNIIYEYEGGE